MFGYHRILLRVDLDARNIQRAEIPRDVIERTIGGVGLGTWALLSEAPEGVDAEDPSAALVIALSPLVGTPLTTSAKFAVVGKSPLTGRLNDSLSSSRFAIAAKKAGADAIVLRGRADDWCVVVIDDGRLTILPADELLGLSARDTEDKLRRTRCPGHSILAIGVAGERGVRYATLSHDGRHAGRGGLGAVFGAKRIKALAVSGSGPIEVADPERVVRIARDLSKRSVGPATEKYREMGTVANLLTFNRLSVLPTRNFRESTFEQAEAISGEAFATVAGKVRKSCAACTIGCEHLFPLAEGGSVRLEYESLFALGSLCGIGDRNAILRAAQACDEVGIDTISFGGTYAFACECVERGLLDPPTDVELRFGSAEGLLQAVRLVGRNEGTGRLLAQGSRRMAEELGQGAIDFAPQVKGMEIPGYEPRTLQMMALGFAVGTRGADHNRSSAYEVDFSNQGNRLDADARDVGHAIETEDRAALLDSLILCKFLRGVFDDLYAESAEMLAAVTGIDRSGSDLRATTSRIVLLKRYYNEREGWTRSEDTLPARFLEEPVSDGVGSSARLTAQRLDELIGAYYRLRGLTTDGRLPADFVP